ncbi:MAG: RagB/SusD family nutrient uptake outer membrane protein [Gemmatimonadetes bacterium]|nr:RagB/SusD family nutrient uptake outer membrane protein [Gemmatimonadota bacterium]
MRNTHIACLVVLATLQVACGDLLTETPRSTVVVETFYKTEADARAAIVAAYQPFTTGNLFGTALQWGLNAGTDDARVGQEEENPVIISLSRMNYDSRISFFANSWRGLYLVIGRANIVLEKVPAINMDEAAKQSILGEAKFLRALSYHYLVRLWGDVPLVRTPEEQLTVGTRAPKAEVYAQIIKDAQEAAAALPATRDAGNRGRATKTSAQALLAEVYLWRSTRESSNEWAAAAAAAKQIIDSGAHRLTPTFIDAFLPGSQNRPEEVFAIQASAATGASQISIAVWTYPRQLLPNQAGGWATYTPLPWFMNSYPAGDVRGQTGSQVGLPGQNGVGFFTSGRLLNGTVVNFEPRIYKFRPSTRPGPQDANWPIFRYADVLLMYAEAVNELGRPDEAIQYVNMVRARARNGTGSENRAQPASLPVTNQAATREAIFQERHWELAFEGKRWFDLVRRGSGYFLASLRRDPTATDADVNDMLWPIPETERGVSPGLTQNPGY